jgi:hypothetical protein
MGVQRGPQDIIHASRAQHQVITGKVFWIMMNLSIPRGAMRVSKCYANNAPKCWMVEFSHALLSGPAFPSHPHACIILFSSSLVIMRMAILLLLLLQQRQDLQLSVDDALKLCPVDARRFR